MKENNNVNNNQIHTDTSDFIIQLYLLIIGLSIGYSAENFISKPSFAGFARFLTVMIMLVVWLHGQLGFSESETYTVGRNWLTRVFEHYIEIASAVLPMMAALLQKMEIHFYYAIVATYGFDLILEAAYIIRLKDSGDRYTRECELARSWLLIDVVTVLLVSVLLFARINQSYMTEIITSTSVFIVITIVTFYDYSRNRDYYFGLSLYASNRIGRIKALKNKLFSAQDDDNKT